MLLNLTEVRHKNVFEIKSYGVIIWRLINAINKINNQLTKNIQGFFNFEIAATRYL